MGIAISNKTSVATQQLPILSMNVCLLSMILPLCGTPIRCQPTVGAKDEAASNTLSGENPLRILLESNPDLSSRPSCDEYGYRRANVNRVSRVSNDAN